MEFKSEISYKFLIALVIFFVIIGVLTGRGDLQTKGFIVVTSIHAFTLLFIFYVFNSIKYIITNDNVLKIRCSFLYNKEIPINSIKSITKTSSLLSSPAASLTKRIELKFGKYNSVIISPKRRLVFVKTLQEINPDIESKL